MLVRRNLFVRISVSVVVGRWKAVRLHEDVDPVERCHFMSKCKMCARATLCDWETPPENCLDYRESSLPSVESMMYRLPYYQFCEVVLRGGARIRGHIAGLNGDYLMLERDDGTVAAIDMDSGAELRTLDPSGGPAESRHESL